jgi:ribosomal protein S4
MNYINQITQYQKNLIYKLLVFCGYTQKKPLKRLIDNKLNDNYSNWYQHLYYKNSINLLFSYDQFMYEFLLKYPQRLKISNFKIRLKEQKKLCMFYGYLSKKQLKNYFLKSKSSPGDFSKNLVSLLESRLDVVVYRTGFAKNIITARQLVAHKKILVNDKILTIPGYLLKPGDIISINRNSYIKIRKAFMQNFKKKDLMNSMLLPINMLDKWATQHNDFSKKELEFFISILAKKIFSRAFLKRYKNPFSSLQNMLNFPYFYLSRSHHYQSKQAMLTKEILEYYRKILVDFITKQKATTLDKKIFVLQLKKYLNKPLPKNKIVEIMNLKKLKPLHLEVSYKLCTCIYLYSPQRVYYPFIIDFDILKK